MRHKITTIAASTVIVIASLAGCGAFIGGEFAPAEDMSSFMITAEAPVGISLEAMDRKMQEMERIVLSQPEIRSGFAALDIEERGRVNSGIMFMRMFKPDQRETTQAEVVQRLRRELAQIEGLQASVIEFCFYNVARRRRRKGPRLLDPRPRASTSSTASGGASSSGWPPNPVSSTSTPTSTSSSRSSS